MGVIEEMQVTGNNEIQSLCNGNNLFPLHNITVPHYHPEPVRKMTDTISKPLSSNPRIHRILIRKQRAVKNGTLQHLELTVFYKLLSPFGQMFHHSLTHKQ